MWDLPRPGLEPVSPALTGRLSTTAPPGKPSLCVLIQAIDCKLKPLCWKGEFIIGTQRCFTDLVSERAGSRDGISLQCSAENKIHLHSFRSTGFHPAADFVSPHSQPPEKSLIQPTLFSPGQTCVDGSFRVRNSTGSSWLFCEKGGSLGLQYTGSGRFSEKAWTCRVCRHI